MKPQPEKPRSSSSPVKADIAWKDPDFNARLRHWGEFGEYFEAKVEIDPKTGKGTIELQKP